MSVNTMFLNALELAQNAHYSQVDKQGAPYIDHCLSVAAAFDDEVHRTVGMLHDIIEDTWVSFHELGALFPAEVVHAVEHLTRREVYGEHYNEYIKRVALNPIARAVKIADLKHNLSRISGLALGERARLSVRYEWALAFLQNFDYTNEELSANE